MNHDDKAPPDTDRHRKRLDHPGATRPSVRNSDLDLMIGAAWAAGWWCERAGNNHVKCYPPDGGRMIPVPSTPSDWRTISNKRGHFRRAGLDL